MHIHAVRDLASPQWTMSTVSIQYDGPLAYAGKAAGWQEQHDDTREAWLPFGFCMEDVDRGLAQTMTLTEIARLKVREETAIPTGKYQVRRTWSPKFGRSMMEVLDVPGFRGIRIHPGNDASDTAGCLLVGLRRSLSPAKVTSSVLACRWLDARVAECQARAEPVYLTIQRSP